MIKLKPLLLEKTNKIVKILTVGHWVKDGKKYIGKTGELVYGPTHFKDPKTGNTYVNYKVKVNNKIISATSIKLIKESLREAKEVKIYVQKGKKPPKGKKLQKGPKGGQYFMGTPGEKTSYEKGTSTPKKKVNIFDKPKKQNKLVSKPKKKEDKKTFNYNGKKYSVSVDQIIKAIGNPDLDKFVKLQKSRHGYNYIGKLKPGTYDPRDSNTYSAFVSFSDIVKPVKKKKTFNKSEMQDAEWMMDKWMPESPEIQDEYYSILEDGDIGELENFFETYADMETLDGYLPDGATLEDFTRYIYEKNHKFSDEENDDESMKSIGSKFEEDGYELYSDPGDSEVSVVNKYNNIVTFLKQPNGTIDAIVMGMKRDIPVEDIGNTYEDMVKFLEDIDDAWINEYDPDSDYN